MRRCTEQEAADVIAGHLADVIPEGYTIAEFPGGGYRVVRLDPGLPDRIDIPCLNGGMWDNHPAPLHPDPREIREYAAARERSLSSV